MSIITILTPTYNRAKMLPKLYESLTEQTDQDFEWLVIDDGSKDHTEELVRGFQLECKLRIIYVRQPNGGKHTALNRGIAKVQTELTFIVDSDDYLPKDAIEIIKAYHEKYRGTPNLCGYSFLRCHQDGNVNTAYFPEDEKIDTYRAVRINGGIGGDKAEVFYTEILRQYPFPVYEGETYMPEDVVWMRMSERYQMVHINKNIYICDYLEDGLTNSGHRMKRHSPKGMTLRSQIYLNDPQVIYKVKVKMMLLYIIYGKFARYNMRQMRKDSGHEALWYVCFIPACLIYLKWRREK